MRDTILAKLSEFSASATANVLNIEVADGEDIVQVARSDDSLELMLGTYPGESEPGVLLPAKGITVPAQWEVREWEADAYAQFICRDSNAEEIADFAAEVFTKLYECEEGTELVFTIE